LSKCFTNQSIVATYLQNLQKESLNTPLITDSETSKHKPEWNKQPCRLLWCHVSLMDTTSSKVLPKFLLN